MNLVPVRFAIVVLNMCLIAFLWWYGLDHFLGGGDVELAMPDLRMGDLRHHGQVNAGLLPYRVVWERFGQAREIAAPPPVQPRDVDELRNVGIDAMALSYVAENEAQSSAFIYLSGRIETATMVRVGDTFQNNFEVVSIKPKGGAASTISVTLRDRRGKDVVFDFDQEKRD